jgi:hypothetical protein
VSLTESLRILITANGAQAEREFAKTGAAARAGLGQAEAATARFGRQLTSAGIAMATFGGVALFGLYKAAQAADEENRAIAQLNNSIQNSPALVGASTDAFLEQASALQKVTVFGDETTISAQAMLATFRLTEDQILSLTPLVQDLSAKFGVDLNTAAIAVGKAMQGNTTTLRRWGVFIDEGANATEDFDNLLSGLRENAGGFAAQEGETFAGQLQILRNGLGDVAEGVGRGAIAAINDMVGPVGELSDRFSSLNPEMQATVGRMATFGASGLLLAGGVSFLAGQVLTAAARFKALRDSISLTTVASRGAVGGVLLLATAIGVKLGRDSMQGASVAVDELVAALTSGRMPMERFVQTALQVAAVGDQIGGFDSSAIGEMIVAVGRIDATQARELGDALLAAGADANVVRDALMEVLQVGNFAGASGGAERALADQFGVLGDAAEGAQSAISDLSEEIATYLDSTLGIGQAQDATASAFNNLFEQLLSGPRAFEGNTEAAIDNRAALDRVVEGVANEIDVLQQQGRGEQAFQNTKQRSIERIREAARLHLIEEGAARRAIAAIRAIPPRHDFTFDADADISDAMAGLDRLEGRIREVAISYNQADFNRAQAATGRGGGGGGGGGRAPTGTDRSGGRSDAKEFAREVNRGGPLLVKVVN